MQVIEVAPVIPAAIGRLPELASNLSFSWHRTTRALFEDLDATLWQQTGCNPRLMLRCVDQRALDAASRDEVYLGRYREAIDNYDSYQSRPVDRKDEPLIAYFCAEYGFHESFPIYSGGLGILAGDHCKAASDECLNFVAVGLLYRQGYFTQSVDSDGVQHPINRDTDPRDLPVEAVKGLDGTGLKVSVPIGQRDVWARVWRAQVGRVSVYLLDTDVPENSEADRDITFRLYGGDEGVRIRQEMMLGIGGLRVLRALGLAPQVWHMNEGHAAFLVFELLREQIAAGASAEVGLEAVAAQCVFTTHTPVAAGHDAFHDGMFIEHFEGMAARMGLPIEWLLALGRAPGVEGFFNMTRLALNGARRMNGVSRIHGAVSADLCGDHWREVPKSENPMGYVTNGVHVPTFIAPVFSRLLDAEMPEWRDRLSDQAYWAALEKLPDDKFWAVSQDAKSRMLQGVRRRLEKEYERKSLSAVQLRHITRNLDPSNPNVLTIGFARRFATYKRAALIMRDRERLRKLVSDADRPILFLFAGKAHPADHPGQQVLREVKQLMLQPEFAGRVVFLEDYDINLARWLVTGVDVWLNNPIAPLEASGTSGIKAAVNGRLNLSILDGWWAEASDGTNGWGIPGSDAREDGRRDELDSSTILDVLAEEVMPLYYDRGADGLPHGWIRRCKRAMATVVPQFNMRRTVSDYKDGLYDAAAEHGQRLLSQGGRGATELADWKRRIRFAWPHVQLSAVLDAKGGGSTGSPLTMRVAVQLGGLSPDDLRVEFVATRKLPAADIQPPALCSFRERTPDGQWRGQFRFTGETTWDGASVYELSSIPPSTGQYEANVRVYPWHPLLAHPHEMGLMRST
jgi:starch phosphorylase